MELRAARAARRRPGCATRRGTGCAGRRRACRVGSRRPRGRGPARPVSEPHGRGGRRGRARQSSPERRNSSDLSPVSQVGSSPSTGRTYVLPGRERVEGEGHPARRVCAHSGEPRAVARPGRVLEASRLRVGDLLEPSRAAWPVEPRDRRAGVAREHRRELPAVRDEISGSMTSSPSVRVSCVAPLPSRCMVHASYWPERVE